MVASREQYAALIAVQAERAAQDNKWGEQNHPDISAHLQGMRHPEVVAGYYGIPTADKARASCNTEHGTGQGSWFSIHIEELAEALEAAASGDKIALRAELVQTAATIVAHIEKLDRDKENTL